MSGRQPASALGMGPMRPRSRGVLRLDDPDPHCSPEIRLNLAADPEDERRLVEVVGLLLALADTPDLAAQHTGLVTVDGQVLRHAPSWG